MVCGWPSSAIAKSSLPKSLIKSLPCIAWTSRRTSDTPVLKTTGGAVSCAPRGARMKSIAMKNVIIGTAGHNHHGQTALVRGLTRIDNHRLKEGKERGVFHRLG